MEWLKLEWHKPKLLKVDAINRYEFESEFNNKIQPLEICERRELAYLDIKAMAGKVIAVFENTGMQFLTFQIGNAQISALQEWFANMHVDWVLEGANNNFASFVFNYGQADNKILKRV